MMKWRHSKIETINGLIFLSSISIPSSLPPPPPPPPPSPPLLSKSPTPFYIHLLLSSLFFLPRLCFQPAAVDSRKKICVALNMSLSLNELEHLSADTLKTLWQPLRNCPSLVKNASCILVQILNWHFSTNPLIMIHCCPIMESNFILGHMFYTWEALHVLS